MYIKDELITVAASDILEAKNKSDLQTLGIPLFSYSTVSLFHLAKGFF